MMEEMKMKRVLFALVLLISTHVYPETNTVLSPQEVYVEGNGRGVNDFYIFRYELSVREYRKYLELSGEKFDFDEYRYWDGPANQKIMGEDSAMINIDFYQAVQFANWLSAHHNLQPAYTIKGNKIEWNRKANGYRMPTSAEWGWAARGGKLSKGYKYPGSNNLDEVAWYSKIIDDIEKSRPVGQKKPNELGIYDMFGNVSEWCWNPYIAPKKIPDHEIKGELKLPNGNRVIPMGTQTGSTENEYIYRVIRGMNFLTRESYLQYGKDIDIEYERIGEYIGVRLVRNAR
jgi:formylglycine-generating enzyme required for sulfatase activity